MSDVERLLLKVCIGLLAYSIGALSLARRMARAGDQRLWSEV